MKKGITKTMGMDLGDRRSTYVVLDEAGEVVNEGKVPTTKRGLQTLLSGGARARVVMEVGAQSKWVSRFVERLGHEVVVANPRKLRLIYENPSKSDQVDAEYLARVGRLDVALLAPVQHRGEEAAKDLRCCARASSWSRRARN